jgi:predicted deacylase
MLRDVSVRELPTGERLRIVKHRFMPIGLDEAEVSYLPRACVITGMHGDELEGQYVIYELVRRL